VLDGLLVIHTTGVPIYYYRPDRLSKERDNNNVILFSGLLTAIQAFLKEVEIGEARIFETEKNLILIHPSKNYFITILIPLSKKGEMDTYSKLVNEINMAIKKWEKELDGLDVEVLSSFKGKAGKTLTEIIKKWEKEASIPVVAKKLKECLW